MSARRSGLELVPASGAATALVFTDRVVRCREALQIVGVSRATLYRLPIRRVKITDGQTGAVGWWLSDLRGYLELRTTGGG